MAAVVVTLAMSITSGVLTGFILQIPFFTKLKTCALFDDKYWSVSFSNYKGINIKQKADQDDISTTAVKLISDHVLLNTK